MHVTSKDSSHDGRSHLLTSVIEADGAAELVRADQVVTLTPVSVVRTSSGGIEVVVSVTISETVLEPVPELPSAADLDAVAEEQRAMDATAGTDESIQ